MQKGTATKDVIFLICLASLVLPATERLIYVAIAVVWPLGLAMGSLLGSPPPQ